MNNLEISCQNLSKSFSGKKIFSNLNLNISWGQSICITGRNGSGKSTLIKIIANLIQPTDGKVTIHENGKEIEKDNWNLKTGLLSPYLNLYDELTVIENLIFFYELKSSMRKNHLDYITGILEKFSLYKVRNELVKNFSTGMKQKLKLAFAILHNPEVLLLDEPFTNLDEDGIKLVHQVANDQRKNGILIMATNNKRDNDLCDSSINIEDYK